MTQHKHNWKHDRTRQHGRAGMIFVRCMEPGCTARAQASIQPNGKFGTPFSTARQYVGERKTEHGNYRLTKTRKGEIVSVFGSVQNYLDNGRVM